MNRSVSQSTVIISATVISLLYVLYRTIWNPYFVQPKTDFRFLSDNPTKVAILTYFGPPSETIQAGDKFSHTGWHPLPDRIATDTSYAFVRRDGRKLYVFISTNNTLEAFVVTRS